MSLISSKTSLKSLKYSDFIQSRKVETPSDIKSFGNTNASINSHRSPDTKSGLGLQIEKRKEDVIRLGKATVNSPQAIRFQTNQALLNQSGTINKILRGDKLSEEDRKEVAIGAARVAGVTASAITQAAGSGTGLRVLQGFVPLNGGYVREEGSLLGAAVASLNPFGTDNQISKAYIALRGEKINDGFIGTGFEEAQSVSETRTNPTTVRRPEDRTKDIQDDTDRKNFFKKAQEDPLNILRMTSEQLKELIVPGLVPIGKVNTYLGQEYSKRPEVTPIKVQDSSIFVKGVKISAEKRESFSTGSFSDSESYIGKTTNPALGNNSKLGKFVSQTTAVDKVTRKGEPSGQNTSLEKRFYVGGSTTGRDKINVLSFETVALGNDTQIEDQDIIPFTIQNIPATGNTEFLYFRAYLDSMSDSYSGEWSGTRYIGRAEELYNYTGFKRGLQFSFKIAAHSPEELKPLYGKLNRLVGTTAPTYQDGLFMQGVFSKITIGDYVQKLPGFFTSVDLTWQTTYPWEIGNVDTGAAIGPKIPRVPHILDVSVSFQPVHDFAPQYDKTFIGFSSDFTLTAQNG